MIDWIGKTQFWRLCWKLLQNFETFSLKLEKGIDYYFSSSFCSLKCFFLWTRGRKIWHPWQKIQLKVPAISAALPKKMIFFLINSFLPKVSSGHKECNFDDPSGFLSEARESWAASRKMMGKTFFVQRHFSAKNFLWSRSLRVISSKSDIERNFFQPKKFRPSVREIFADSPKKKNMIKVLKKVFRLYYLLDRKDSVLTTRPKISSQYTPIFHRLEWVDVKRRFQTEVLPKNVLCARGGCAIFFRIFFLQNCPLNP